MVGMYRKNKVFGRNSKKTGTYHNKTLRQLTWVYNKYIVSIQQNMNF